MASNFVGSGGMLGCDFKKRKKAWECQIGDTKFDTRVLEIEKDYDPGAIIALTYDYEGKVEGQLAVTGYALGKVVCTTPYGDPLKGVNPKVICRIVPLPKKEREEYLRGEG